MGCRDNDVRRFARTLHLSCFATIGQRYADPGILTTVITAKSLAFDSDWNDSFSHCSQKSNVNYIVLWKIHIFQWRVRRLQIQDKSRTPWNPGQGPEIKLNIYKIKDWPGKSRTDGHLTEMTYYVSIGTLNFTHSLTHSCIFNIISLNFSGIDFISC